MDTIPSIGLDIAKSVFLVHGIDAADDPFRRCQLKCRLVNAFFRKLEPCLVGIEASVVSHHSLGELITLVVTRGQCTALGRSKRIAPSLEEKSKLVFNLGPGTVFDEVDVLFLFLPRDVLLLQLARRTRNELGRALPLYPGTSDLDLLGDFKSIVDFDAEISHGALDLRVSKQQLYRTEVASAFVDQRRLRPAD